MRPIAIFRHFRTEGSGYFSIFLEHHGIPWRLVTIDEGSPVPDNPHDFSGLCFMGGPMSVNDPLPWIEKSCALIRAAVAVGIPVIGHCLGGQLISKALGGTVNRNPVKEIGWGCVTPAPGDTSRYWLGDLAEQTATVFQWHGETFSIPPGATRLLGNAHCSNQAFVLGPHLGMQCHIEMTPEMIVRWSKGWGKEIADLDPLPSSVQTPEVMQNETACRLPAMRQLADQLYSTWISGLHTE